jgi:hypothetical protein
MKAKQVKIAGQNDKNQSLFAIIDEFGRTAYQVWCYQKEIITNYKLI